MCGIYGITKKDIPFVENFIKICAYRGPDGSEIWSDDDVTLGHNLLSITSHPNDGKQPWVTEKGNVLIYNGEIFNYHDLCKKYQNQFTPKTSCDTELLAFLLDRDIQSAIDEIDSMHAFAYYDKQNKLITISRDHAGIKPLYYAETKDGLMFGSEIKGMLDVVPNSRTLDPLAAKMMSTTGLNISENTFFTNIKKLLPGQTIVFDIKNKKIKSQSINNVYPDSNTILDSEEFRYQVEQTVAMSTLGIRKFGIFLSGGLDSTLVALELKKQLGELDAFTNKIEPNIIANGEDHNDDYIHAKKFSEQYGLNFNTILCTPKTVMENWDDSIYTFEEPRYAMSLPMYYQTNRILSQKGIVVTMAGDMGDELLGGYQKYWKLRKDNINSFSDLIWKWMKRVKRPLMLTNTGIDEHDIHAHIKKIIPDQIWNDQDPINSYMALDCITQVPEEFFSRNDKFGMKFSMEGRFPLATKQFMKYCLSIHSNHKIGENKSDTKLPTKIAYQNILPNYIIQKMKTGWTVPLNYWLAPVKYTHVDYDIFNFAQSYMKKNDGLKSIVSQKNWEHGKTKVVSWIVRSWAQLYNINL